MSRPVGFDLRENDHNAQLLEGYQIGEVATLLSLPEGTVKSRLYLARNV